jgi:hypothetical protein
MAAVCHVCWVLMAGNDLGWVTSLAVLWMVADSDETILV